MPEISEPHSMSDMVSSLKSYLSPNLHRIVTTTIEKASESNVELHLVGGAVRDMLLERPIEDVDLVMEGDASKLAFQVAKILGGEIISYHRFGTTSIKVKQYKLDMATARRERYKLPGALPDVFPSSITEDLRRRDFTINAMALTLTGPKAYQLIDPTGGKADLKHRLIRILHKNSFRDDPTRLFRAIKYEQRLSFNLDPETLSSLHMAANQEILNTVSPDRIFREIELIFGEKRPDLTLRRGGELNIFKMIYAPLGDLSWIASLVYKSRGKIALEYLAAMSYYLNKEQSVPFIKRLNMQKEWAKIVQDSITLRSYANRLAKNDLPASKLCKLLDPLSPISIKGTAPLTPNTLAETRMLEYLDRIRYISPYLTGKDLIDLGFPSGPKIGTFLQQLREACLDGRVTNKEEEIDLARKYLLRYG